MTETEQLALKMIHLRSGMYDALREAQEMYLASLEVAQGRIRYEQERQQSQKEHEERIREIHREAQDYCNKLREETNRRRRESDDRHRYKWQTMCQCGRYKAAGHLYCVECFYDYQRTRW